jgi:protein gp37
MSNTSIEWTEKTWNPLTGCTKVSPGCKHCYAERMALRLKAMGQPNYANGFKLTLQENMLFLPMKWKKPQMIFVNSMSDMFHKDVPVEYIKRIFDVMNLANHHTYQILTKRSDRLLELDTAGHLDWSPHIWMGVSVESEKYQYRIDHLRKTYAMIKFLSLEPLLENLPALNLDGIHWGIVGGESGPGHRPIEVDWVRCIRDQFILAEVPFFFKQWGGSRPKEGGRSLDGMIWSQYPSIDGVVVEKARPSNESEHRLQNLRMF